MRLTSRALAVGIVVLLAACTTAPGSVAVPTVTEPASSSAPAETGTPIATRSPDRTQPVARVYHHLVSVDSLGGVLLFGGITSSPPDGGVFLGDGWVSQAPPAWTPADRDSSVPMGDAVAYDAGSDRVVLFAVVAPGDSFDPQNETWAYGPASDEWSLVGKDQPPGLHGARAAYDSESDRIIVVAPEAGRVWAYDLDSDSWEERASHTPGIDTYHGIAYDADSDRVVVFGGGTGTGPGATLAYDYNTDTWADLSTDDGPTDRVYQAMTYDPSTDRIIMFGGVQGGAEAPLDETWTYDLDTNTWAQLHPSTQPGPRGWAAMAFNATGGTAVLFGGGPRREEATDETWVFDPASNAWTKATP